MIRFSPSIQKILTKLYIYESVKEKDAFQDQKMGGIRTPTKNHEDSNKMTLNSGKCEESGYSSDRTVVHEVHTRVRCFLSYV